MFDNSLQLEQQIPPSSLTELVQQADWIKDFTIPAQQDPTDDLYHFASWTSKNKPVENIDCMKIKRISAVYNENVFGYHV